MKILSVCGVVAQVYYKRGDVPDLRPYEDKLVDTRHASIALS